MWLGAPVRRGPGVEHYWIYDACHLHVTRLLSLGPGCEKKSLLTSGFRREWWETVERENTGNFSEGFAMRRSRGVRLEMDCGSRRDFSIRGIL